MIVQVVVVVVIVVVVVVVRCSSHSNKEILREYDQWRSQEWRGSEPLDMLKYFLWNRWPQEERYICLWVTLSVYVSLMLVCPLLYVSRSATERSFIDLDNVGRVLSLPLTTATRRSSVLFSSSFQTTDDSSCTPAHVSLATASCSYHHHHHHHLPHHYKRIRVL